MNGAELYLRSEKLMGPADDAEPEGPRLRDLAPAVRLVLADVGQYLVATEEQISRRTGLPRDYVRMVIAGLDASGFLETTPGHFGPVTVMPGRRLSLVAGTTLLVHPLFRR